MRTYAVEAEATPSTPFTPSEPALSAIPVAARRRVARLARHRLLASAIAFGDSRLDFESFAAAMLADLDPHGPLETTLAARAIGLGWRLNRAQALESAFLSKPDSFGAGRTPIEQALDNSRDLAAVEALQRWETSLQRNLAHTLALLETSRRSIDRLQKTADKASISAPRPESAAS